MIKKVFLVKIWKKSGRVLDFNKVNIPRWIQLVVLTTMAQKRFSSFNPELGMKKLLESQSLLVLFLFALWPVHCLFCSSSLLCFSTAPSVWLDDELRIPEKSKKRKHRMKNYQTKNPTIFKLNIDFSIFKSIDKGKLMSKIWCIRLALIRNK